MGTDVQIRKAWALEESPQQNQFGMFQNSISACDKAAILIAALDDASRTEVRLQLYRFCWHDQSVLLLCTPRRSVLVFS
jgi:hypothetical protein